MSRDPHLVLAVVTAAPGVLLVHRPGEDPPARFPATRPERGEQPAPAAERATREETGLRVRGAKTLGRRTEAGRAHPVLYVAATPLAEFAPGAVTYSLRAAWYSLSQVELLLPDLIEPVYRHLEATINRHGI